MNSVTKEEILAAIGKRAMTPDELMYKLWKPRARAMRIRTQNPFNPRARSAVQEFENTCQTTIRHLLWERKIVFTSRSRLIRNPGTPKYQGEQIRLSA